MCDTSSDDVTSDSSDNRSDGVTCTVDGEMADHG